MRYEIHHGDNLAWLRSQPDNSIDSFVTDPPYGLGKEPDMVKCLQDWIDHDYHEVGGSGFMGKKWDAFVPQPIFWKEVFRVLKHGGHVVSFGGTRTYDLMVLAMRLAGFEIRDQLIWMYGGGFPKSGNVSKMIDKQAGAVREVVGTVRAGISRSARKGGEIVGAKTFEELKQSPITIPATPEAQQWDGFGTALSPSHEPIVLARKPLEKGLTIAQNVLKWGTGALNIDGCRIGTENTKRDNYASIGYGGSDVPFTSGSDSGRWPSNLLLANVPSVVGLFPENAKSGAMKHEVPAYEGESMFFNGRSGPSNQYGDSGSASRYFFRADLLPIEIEEQLTIDQKAIYCSKPSKYERQLGKISETSHPTVKPVAMMHHLVTLVTPPNGVCCDPFLGSGTTGIASMLGGFQFKGCEMTDEYIPISTNRINNWKHYRQFLPTDEHKGQASLF